MEPGKPEVYKTYLVENSRRQSFYENFQSGRFMDTGAGEQPTMHVLHNKMTTEPEFSVPLISGKLRKHACFKKNY